MNDKLQKLHAIIYLLFPHILLHAKPAMLHVFIVIRPKKRVEWKFSLFISILFVEKRGTMKNLT